MSRCIKALCYEHGVMFEEERLVSALWSHSVETSRGFVAAVIPGELSEQLGVSVRKLKTLRQRVGVSWLTLEVKPHHGWVATFDRQVLKTWCERDNHLTNSRVQAGEPSTGIRPSVPEMDVSAVDVFLEALGLDRAMLGRLLAALSSLGTQIATCGHACVSRAPASSSSASVDDDQEAPAAQMTAAAQQPRTPERKNQNIVPDAAADAQNPNVQVATSAHEDDVQFLHAKFAQYGFNVSVGVCQGLAKASKKPFGDDCVLWREFVELKISRFVGTSYPMHVMWDALRTDGRTWLKDWHRDGMSDEVVVRQPRTQNLQQHQPEEQLDVEDPYGPIPWHLGVRGNR